MDVLAAVLRRLRARLFPPGEGLHPELYEIERRAAVAMAACTCAHPWDKHEHAHPGTACSACRCERFRPAPPVSTTAEDVARPGDVVEEVLIRVRVFGWTRAWRDHRRP